VSVCLCVCVCVCVCVIHLYGQVFPWELITGGPGAAGSKLFRKNSVDRPSDPATRNMALWLSTLMNVILGLASGWRCVLDSSHTHVDTRARAHTHTHIATLAPRPRMLSLASLLMLLPARSLPCLQVVR
jgi:hypothetical protein